MLAGEVETLEPLRRAADPPPRAASLGLVEPQGALDRFPRTTFALAKSRVVWPVDREARHGRARGRARRPRDRAPAAQGARAPRARRRRSRARLQARGRAHALGAARLRRDTMTACRATSLTTLDGGGRVITEPLPSVRSVAIGFWIGAGSRDEDDAHAGLSHFLEHLLFKGTRSYSALEIAEIFDALGGELNASTARDYTVVYARVLDEHLETALDVMTDMVFAPTLDRRRLRARGRPRGDRDGRGLAAGARPRSLHARPSSATIRSAGPCSAPRR